MKSKRIVALALTAAMAVSMASMTAFAANPPTWKDYKTTAPIQSRDDENYKEFYEGYVVNYQVKKLDGSAPTDTTPFRYVYRKGSTVEESTTNGVTTRTYKLNDGATGDDTQSGEETASVLWKNFKTVAKGLGAPSLEEEDNCVFLGWTLDSNNASTYIGWDKTDGNNATARKWVEDNKKADDLDYIVKDDDDIISKQSGVDGKTATPLVFYPVFREKTSAEKLQSQVNIANRAKVAKPAGDKEWVYSQKDLDRTTAKVSDPLAEDVSGDALKKCNAEMKHSRVYEIKPQVDGKVVDLKKGATQEVVIPIKTLYAAGDVATDKDVNDLIKKGKLKVFHIGSDGKSRQVTGIKGAGDGTGAVKFKCGSFSEFVITKDPNARAQAGEEDGASGGNPATGEASTLPVAMLALAALSATGVVAYKKRKAE